MKLIKLLQFTRFSTSYISLKSKLNMSTNMIQASVIETNSKTNHYNEFLHITENAVKTNSLELSKSHALIMINSESMDIDLSRRLWDHCEYKICADGGSNRLYDELTKAKISPSRYIPDIIKGDLDSIRSEVKKFYRQKGSEIMYDEDQDTNDLDKCLQELKDKLELIINIKNEDKDRIESATMKNGDNNDNNDNYKYKDDNRNDDITSITDIISHKDNDGSKNKKKKREKLPITVIILGKYLCKDICGYLFL